jgi:hypothetical protein
MLVGKALSQNGVLIEGMSQQRGCALLGKLFSGRQMFPVSGNTAQNEGAMVDEYESSIERQTVYRSATTACIFVAYGFCAMGGCESR